MERESRSQTHPTGHKAWEGWERQRLKRVTRAKGDWRKDWREEETEREEERGSR